MKKVVILFLMLALCGFAFAQGDVGGKLGKHDVQVGGNYMGCLGCHTPHAAPSEYVLWGRALPTQMPVYDQTSAGFTKDYTVGTAFTAGNPAFHTAACMSCHDGITADNVTGVSGTDTWKIGSDTEGLKNDHPTHANPGQYQKTPAFYVDSNNVTQVYGMITGAYTGGGVQSLKQARWYTSSATPAKADWYAECTSCHDPHNGTGYKFVRGTTGTTSADTEKAGLALCRDCHGR